MDPITALRAEEARLEAALRLTPESRQLEAVRAALAALKDAYDETRLKPVGVPYRPKGSGVAPAIIRVAAEELRRTGRRMQCAEFVSALEAEGVGLGGKHPSASIGAVLSANRGVFDNAKDDRGRGYGLVEWSRLEIDPVPAFLSPMAGEGFTPEYLICARKSLNLTQSEMAQQLGVSQQSVVRWEKGRYGIPNPAGKLLRAILPSEASAGGLVEWSQPAVGD